MPHLSSPGNLEEYLALFQGVFRRRDQRRWACLYLQGLLQELPRKNIQTIARYASKPSRVKISDLSQALQHFLHQSPWDEQAVLRRYRAWLAERLSGPTFAVVDEIPFLKQGRHSVGVQRQYSAALGQKVNCQIAVVIHLATATDCYPAALRLYLPSRWLQSPELLAKAGVPLEYRQRRSRWQIALDLLAEVQQDGISLQGIVGGAGLLAGSETWEALAHQGLPWLAEIAPDALPVPLAAGMGVSGRTVAALAEHRPSGATFCPVVRRRREGCCYSWQPLRTALPTGPVLSAEQDLWLFLEEQPQGAVRFAVAGNWPAASLEAAASLWRLREAAAASIRQMKAHLGLDHFEGRSWRGFHHHTCLVLLAQGFLRGNPEASVPR